MAKVKITGHASGSGVITVTAPNTSTNRTITLPDATATLATTAEAFNPDAAQVFNESGADVDFRIESDAETEIFVVNAGLNAVGIGTAVPSARFEVEDGGGSHGNVVMKVTQDDQSSHYGFSMGNDTYSTEDRNGFMLHQMNNGHTFLYNGGYSTANLGFPVAGGITFNGDTAATNTLNDYEEGTWTPTFQAHGQTNPSVGYTINSGHYTKVGRLVTASFNITTSSVSGGNSGHTLELRGLPFAQKNVSGLVGAVTGVKTFNWNGTANNPVTGYVDANQSFAWLNRFTDGDSYDTGNLTKTGDLRTSGDSNQIVATIIYYAA